MSKLILEPTPEPSNKLKRPIFEIIYNAERKCKSPENAKNLKKKDLKILKKEYKRKDKSLEELSHKFLKALSTQNGGLVHLDEMTTRLGNLK